MGEFGIQILGDGDTDVAANGLGVDGEQAVENLMETLGTLGYRSLRAAILAPGAAHPDILEQPLPAAAPVAQLPLPADTPIEAAPWKCPECGLLYANSGTCVGGEFGHAPATLLPVDEVHALADPDGAKAAEVQKAAPPAGPTGNTLQVGEPVDFGAAGQPDRRVGATERRKTQLPVPAGARDRRTGPADRRGAGAGASPSWPTQ
jgi:hypothetical protein